MIKKNIMSAPPIEKNILYFFIDHDSTEFFSPSENPNKFFESFVSFSYLNGDVRTHHNYEGIENIKIFNSIDLDLDSIKIYKKRYKKIKNLLKK